MNSVLTVVREVVFWARSGWLADLYFTVLHALLNRRWFYGAILVYHPINGQLCARVPKQALIPDRIDGYKVDRVTDVCLEYTWNEPVYWRSGKMRFTGWKGFEGTSCIYFKDEVKYPPDQGDGYDFFVEVAQPALDRSDRLYLVFTGFDDSGFTVEFFNALVLYVAVKGAPPAVVIVDESGEAGAALDAITKEVLASLQGFISPKPLSREIP